MRDHMPQLSARKLADISAVVRAVRADRAITQTELSERLAFSRDYLVALESGQGTLYTNRLFRLLHELDITVTLTYGNDHAGS